MNYKAFGLTVVLIIYLVFFCMLLGDYKTWEPDYKRLIQGMSPIYPKFFMVCKYHSKIIIELTGTIGILLAFASMYGSKITLKVLIFATFILILAVNYTAREVKMIDFKENAIWLLSLIGLTIKLMQGW